MTTLADQQTFTTMVARLSRLSVDKHFDAYADVDWDAPDMALDPADPRLELPPFDPLARTEWYRSQPPEVRARIGLYRYGACMKIGWHFENLLQRGLLSYLIALPNGSPEFRYLHHEVIEESEHTLMFQEFVNRTGMPVRGMPRSLRLGSELLGAQQARQRLGTIEQQHGAFAAGERPVGLPGPHSSRGTGPGRLRRGP